MNRIGVVLDKSGSMEPIRTDTIGGFNAWLAGVRATGQSAKVTLTLFDTAQQQLWDGKAIEGCDPLTPAQYVPGGSTALNDALGDTLEAMQKHGKKADRRLVVVITDGQENASHRFTRSDLKATIEKLTGKGWEFVYLGANVDAFAESSSYGIKTSTNYFATADSVAMVFDSVATASADWSGGGSTIGSMPETVDADGNPVPAPTT